ncbi:hypothetical protein SH661x_001929 [Planctomicrobium sp. SH661]|uniref:hypothetical protein n=1 Tax=Planctomicrobium sp. SH661 TaxID=3448124 RepID=UPI003F5B5A52
MRSKDGWKTRSGFSRKNRGLKSEAQLQQIVDRFNRDYPVGTKLQLRKDTGWIETTVRDPAEVMSGHSAVAWFEGVSGAYSIEDDRIRPAEMDCRDYPQ